MTTDVPGASPALSDQLGLVPERAQVNAWMAEAGWQNSAIRQADFGKVERVVRAAVAAERERRAGIVDQLRTAVLVDDWHTFDALLRELRA